MYAYKTDTEGNIIECYQGVNIPDDFPHRFDAFLEPYSKIINGEVVEKPAPVISEQIYESLSAKYDIIGNNA